MSDAVKSLRKFRKWSQTYSNGNTNHIFDVEQPATWQTKPDGSIDVQCWSLSRLIVGSKKGFEVMRFHRKDGEKQWAKAHNPYAGISLNNEERVLLKEVI